MLIRSVRAPGRVRRAAKSTCVHRHQGEYHFHQMTWGTMMRSSIVKLVIAAAVTLAAQASSHAGTLQVEPVLIDVTAPGAASTVTLRNEGAHRSTFKSRVLPLVAGRRQGTSRSDRRCGCEPARRHIGSESQLCCPHRARDQTSDQRRGKLSGLIDQLPEASQQRTNAVHLLVRYSIPVFFGASERRDPAVAWTVAVSGNRIKVTARNDGERRVRIAALNIRDAKGKTVSFGKGLAGMSWENPLWDGRPRPAALRDGAISVSAQSDTGSGGSVASIGSGR